MNYKLEKFWNFAAISRNSTDTGWTINLKSFEIMVLNNIALVFLVWTINLKSFEMHLNL